MFNLGTTAGAVHRRVGSSLGPTDEAEGKGGFGKVSKVIDLDTGFYVAVKVSLRPTDGKSLQTRERMKSRFLQTFIMCVDQSFSPMTEADVIYSPILWSISVRQGRKLKTYMPLYASQGRKPCPSV
jgi:serine/threonine protein kinase